MSRVFPRRCYSNSAIYALPDSTNCLASVQIHYSNIDVQDTSLTGGGNESSREGSQRKLPLPPLPPGFTSGARVVAMAGKEHVKTKAKVVAAAQTFVVGGWQSSVRRAATYPRHFSLYSYHHLASVSPIAPECATHFVRKRDRRSRVTRKEEGGAEMCDWQVRFLSRLALLEAFPTARHGELGGFCMP